MDLKSHLTILRFGVSSCFSLQNSYVINDTGIANAIIVVVYAYLLEENHKKLVPEDLAPKSLYSDAFLHQKPQKLLIDASCLANVYQRRQATGADLILDRASLPSLLSVFSRGELLVLFI